MVYSKIKYDALRSLYDQIEQGESYASAAEQAIKQNSPHQSLEQIAFTVTIIDRILLLTVALSPYLIEKALAAIKNYQSILGSDLVEQIRTPVYLTDLNILYQRVSSILQREYDAIV